jgi:hypothetical protein
MVEIEFFDLDKVALYVDLLGNATTAAKVGFFLEQSRDSLMVDEAHLKTFRDRCPRRPHYLERSRRKGGSFHCCLEPCRSRRGLRKIMGGTTVRISPETLVNQAEATGFQPNMLEAERQ